MLQVCVLFQTAWLWRARRGHKGCIESVEGSIEKQEKQNMQTLAREEGSAGGGMRRSKLHF